MDASAAYRLLQISDSAFPRGSFAHSLGLETYVQEGTIAGAAALAEFIESVLLQSTATLDGVYLREAHGAAGRGELDAVMRLDRALSAAKPVASLREAGRGVGRQFLRTAVGYIEGEVLRRYEEEVRAGRSPGHHPVALGVAAEALGLTPRDALSSLCYGVITGLVSAAVRLIPLGQTDGQRVTASLEGVVGLAVEEAMGRPLDGAYAFGPGHEIRAMGHRRLYTRLFVS